MSSQLEPYLPPCAAVPVAVPGIFANSMLYPNSTVWQQDTLPRTYDNTLRLEDLLAMPPLTSATDRSTATIQLTRETDMNTSTITQVFQQQQLSIDQSISQTQESLDLTASEAKFGAVATTAASLIGDQLSIVSEPNVPNRNNNPRIDQVVTHTPINVDHIDCQELEQQQPISQFPYQSLLTKQQEVNLSGVGDILQVILNSSQQLQLQNTPDTQQLLPKIQQVNGRIAQIQRQIQLAQDPLLNTNQDTFQITKVQSQLIQQQQVHKSKYQESDFIKNQSQPIQSTHIYHQIEDLTSSQREIESYLIKEQATIDVLLERKAMAKEELIGLLLTRADLVANMEDLEEMQESLVQKSPLECMQMQGILLLRDQIAQSNTVLLSLTHRQSQIQNEIASIEVEYSSNPPHAKKQRLLRELASIEAEIFTRCHTIQLDLSLDQLVLDIFTEESKEVMNAVAVKYQQSIQQSSLPFKSSFNNESTSQAAVVIDDSMQSDIQFKEKIMKYLESKHLQACSAEDAQQLADLLFHYFQTFQAITVIDDHLALSSFSSDSLIVTPRMECLKSEHAQWSQHVHDLSSLIASKEHEISLKHAALEQLIQDQITSIAAEYLATQPTTQRQALHPFNQSITTATATSTTNAETRAKHHMQFYSLLKQNQQNRFTQLEAIHTSLFKVNRNIQTNITIVEISLTRDIEAVARLLEEAVARRTTLVEQKNQTAEAILLLRNQLVETNTIYHHRPQQPQSNQPTFIQQENSSRDVPASLLKELEECEIERLALESNLIELVYNIRTNDKPSHPLPQPPSQDHFQSTHTVKRSLRTITEEQPSTYRGGGQEKPSLITRESSSNSRQAMPSQYNRSSSRNNSCFANSNQKNMSLERKRQSHQFSGSTNSNKRGSINQPHQQQSFSSYFSIQSFEDTAPSIHSRRDSLAKHSVFEQSLHHHHHQHNHNQSTAAVFQQASRRATKPLISADLNKEQFTCTQRQAEQNNQSRTTIFKLHLESLPQKEAAFLLQIKELLEGSLIFKKYSQFDVDSVMIPTLEKADACLTSPDNYGQRIMSIHKNLNKIEIRHPQRLQVIEQVIHVDSIIRLTESPEMNANDLKTALGFSIHLDKGKKVSLMTNDAAVYKKWVTVILQLIKIKRSLPRLKNHIETIIKSD